MQIVKQNENKAVISYLDGACFIQALSSPLIKNEGLSNLCVI